MSHIYLEAHGVKLDVEIRAEELTPAVEQILPPGWERSDEFPEDGHFTIGLGEDGRYEVLAEGSVLAGGLTEEVAVHVLDAQLRARIAFVAPNRIFVHAGVVAIDGRAILIPAASFAGKSSLVAALVEHGATYYSDEFAVLDEEGQVHPYPKPLSMRAADERYGELRSAESLGGPVADVAATPAVIVITRYVPGATWHPVVRAAGVGALALVTNAVPARARPRDTTRAAARAASGALVLEGERGDAGETAAALLAELAKLRDDMPAR
jgi:hypothetical protein